MSIFTLQNSRFFFSQNRFSVAQEPRAFLRPLSVSSLSPDLFFDSSYLNTQKYGLFCSLVYMRDLDCCATQYLIFYLDVRPRTPSTQLKPRWLPVTEALVPDDLAEKLMTVSSLRVRCQAGNVTCRR